MITLIEALVRTIENIIYPKPRRGEGGMDASDGAAATATLTAPQPRSSACTC